MIEAQIQTQPIVEEQTNPQEGQVLTTSQILNDLDNGLDRKQIAKKYGLTAHEVKTLFEMSPVLKGRRPKRALKKITFTLVDDVQLEKDVKAAENQLRVDVEAEKVQDNTSENHDGEEFNSFEIID
jgi:hypothetical protein